MRSNSYLDFTIGHLNIHGIDNSFGCKIPDLESEFLTNDINIFTETWTCSHNKDVPNFSVIEIPPNKMNKKSSGRSSGGILIYYKSYLQDHVKVVKTHSNYVWLEINKDIFINAKHNLRICAVYIPPYDSRYFSSDIFDNLIDDIIDFSGETDKLLLIGDFNARTQCLPDNIPETKQSDNNGIDIPNIGYFIPRSNCDLGDPNSHGRNLLNLCRSSDLRILNGRIFGDSSGNLTCFSNNGASCVDYAIASQSLYEEISLFYVNEQSHLSDHCKITTHIPNRKPIERSQEAYNWKSLNNTYIWDEESPVKFSKALNCIEIKETIANILNDANILTDPNLLVSELSNIFHSAAKTSLKPKTTKNTSIPKKSSRKKKWFDSECKLSKSELNKISKQKHRNPFNEMTRIRYREKLKQYKSLLHTKRKSFWNEKIMNLQSNAKDGKFWNIWKDFDENLSRKPIEIQDGSTWENFYKTLFSSNEQNNPNCPASNASNANSSILCKEIDDGELLDTIKKLKNNKAVGYDGISNEMIKNCSPAVFQLIKITFNAIINTGNVPKSWCKGLITPVHKKGPKSNPDNYRGICVANALLKLFCLLLNIRLKSFVDTNKLIHKNQIGFQNISRTSDNILTLKALINKHVNDDSKKKVHAAFIDFRKAFDTVWHQGLFEKLQQKGLDQNFLRIIECMYYNTECAVKLNNKCTNFFKCSKGVRQGCPLSPTLFNIYINDLIDELDGNNPNPLNLNNEPITCLFYADDLIILSSSHDGLQRCLNSLHEYCNRWKLEVNNVKSKCMTFYKNNSKYKNTFHINKVPLENVTEYTYLGITINAACNFKETLNMLSAKANRALLALNNKCKIKYLPIKIALKLFDSLISPILLYGSEVWAPYLNLNNKEWDKCEIEKIHTQFLKRILGLNRSTTNALVRAELGRFPLSVEINCRIHNFIKHVYHYAEPDSLVALALAYESSVINRNSIISYLDKFIPRPNSNESISLSRQDTKIILKQNYHVFWNSYICDCSKALTYKTHKNRIFFEPYLQIITNRKYRRTLSKLRLSDHCLEIEKGRHCRPPIVRDERFCKSCVNKVENEVHFLLDCKNYEIERTEFLSEVHELYPNFSNIPTSEQKYIFLMSNEDNLFLSILGKYVTEIYKKRHDLSFES